LIKMYSCCVDFRRPKRLTRRGRSAISTSRFGMLKALSPPMGKDTKTRRDKKEAEGPHPERKEVKINAEIRCRNPAGNESRPEKAGHQPEATMASSPEMAARSGWGESRSRVIESRNGVDRWSLRVRVSGGRRKSLVRRRAEVLAAL